MANLTGQPPELGIDGADQSYQCEPLSVSLLIFIHLASKEHTG